MSSRPLTWIFDATPIWYRWALSPHGVVGMIAIGNPLLVAVLYLPWLLTSRQSYIYYLTPAIPFLAIVVATAGARLAGPAPLRGRWAATFFVAGAVVMGVAAGGTLAVRLAAPGAVAAGLGGVGGGGGGRPPTPATRGRRRLAVHRRRRRSGRRLAAVPGLVRGLVWLLRAPDVAGRLALSRAGVSRSEPP
jgi:hypothetical protein